MGGGVVSDFFFINLIFSMYCTHVSKMKIKEGKEEGGRKEHSEKPYPYPVSDPTKCQTLP